jgi:hypothetical protein
MDVAGGHRCLGSGSVHIQLLTSEILFSVWLQVGVSFSIGFFVSMWIISCHWLSASGIKFGKYPGT